MKLKLDENFGRAAAALLRAEGHDVSTVIDEGLAGAADAKVIAAARAERRCLVTLDLDFANPVRFDPRDYEGIAVLRLPSRLTHESVLDGVRALVRALGLGDIRGKLWIVDRGRLREYTPGD